MIQPTQPDTKPLTRRLRRALLPRAIALVLVVVLFVLLGWPGWSYHWDWTGFGASQSPPKNPKAPFDYYPAKTLWDWMQLLLVPAVLAAAAAWLNWAQQRREDEAASRREQIAAKNEAEREQESVLGAYLSQMAALLLHEKLDEPGNERPRRVARAQTLTALRRLDGERKAIVLAFLYESQLIAKDNTIVVLDGADLHEAILVLVSLNGANLSGVNLIGANMSQVSLQEGNLAHANLYEARLYKADLHKANLHGAHLYRANISNAILSEANLLFAMLSGAKLIGADLSRANLGGATLQMASLRGANLTGADLRLTILRDASLHGANLYGADLRGVDLTEALGLTEGQIAGAIIGVDPDSHQETKLPGYLATHDSGRDLSQPRGASS